MGKYLAAAVAHATHNTKSTHYIKYKRVGNKLGSTTERSTPHTRCRSESNKTISIINKTARARVLGAAETGVCRTVATTRRGRCCVLRLGRDELVHGVHQVSHLLGERRLLLVKLGEALGVRLVHRVQLLLEQDTLLAALEGLTGGAGRGGALGAGGGR